MLLVSDGLHIIDLFPKALAPHSSFSQHLAKILFLANNFEISLLASSILLNLFILNFFESIFLKSSMLFSNDLPTYKFSNISIG